MTVLVIIAVIAFLIAVNGLYVAAEFSAVSARRPRLAQMADDGDNLAQVIEDGAAGGAFGELGGDLDAADVRAAVVVCHEESRDFTR